MDGILGEGAAVSAAIWQYVGDDIQSCGCGAQPYRYDSMYEIQDLRHYRNEHTRSSEPQCRTGDHGSVAHEEWKHPDIHTGSLYIGNYSGGMYRACGSRFGEKSSRFLNDNICLFRLFLRP